MVVAEVVDTIEKYFLSLEISSVERIDERTIRVKLATLPTISEYQIVFFHDDVDIKFESILFHIAPYAQYSRTLRFLQEMELLYKGLLTINEDLRPLAFALTNMPDNSWVITLSGSQEIRWFDKAYLLRILDRYDNFYANVYPRLKSHLDHLLEGFIRGKDVT
jgi:hypothetical protein